MEKNTVLLDLDRYNQLRDFETKMLQGFCVKVGSTKWGSYREFITESKVVEQLGKDVTELQKTASEYFDKIQDLNREINELKGHIPTKKFTKEVTLEDIKKMSYWEFRKWKKSNG